jgi:hypothetical protein
MTAVLTTSRTRRTATAAGAVALGLLALSACEKPTAMATVTVGSESVSHEAACHADGKKLATEKLRECLDKDFGDQLTVHDGEKVRVGVDPEIAETGWAVVLNGQPAMSEASKDTYKTFPYDQVFAPQQGGLGGAQVPEKVRLTIIQVTKGGDASGTWQFTLKKAS